MLTIDLSGKNILVTGGSRGIGAEIVKALSDCGARVVLHFNRSRGKAETIANQSLGKVDLIQADLEDSSQVANLFHEIEDIVGRLHVIVNNAGIAIESNPDGSDEQFVSDWSRTMTVNLDTVGLLCKQAIVHFRKHGQGNIINISSRAAFRGDTSDFLAYAASKAGIVALTRSIARAYGKEGIVAFNIAPGFVRTEMAQDFINKYGESYALDDIALDRLTEPSDIAPFVAFLASGMADHATGCTIDINAGSYVH